MVALSIWSDLRDRGIELAVDSDRLRFRPASAVDPDLRSRVVEHKADLIRLVEFYEERAAICQYHGGQTREKAEAGALAETLAAMGGEACFTASEPPTFERWTPAQEFACRTKCRECGQRIVWGETDRIFDFDNPDGRPPTNKRERWQKLDPDYVPHVCGAKRVVELTGISEGMAQIERETAARPIGWEVGLCPRP